jgi:hypothetical protein
MPKSVLDAAKIAGGHTIDLIDEDFCALEVTFGDEAYNVVKQWFATLDGEPRLRSAFSPPINLFGTALCPPNSLGAYILWEASSIAHHYAQLNEDAFPTSSRTTLSTQSQGPLPVQPETFMFFILGLLCMPCMRAFRIRWIPTTLSYLACQRALTLSLSSLIVPM